MSYDEVLRRALVALAKRAGTLIRTEELKRQALSASVLRPLAEALLAEVEELLKNIPDYEQAIRSSTERAIKEGRPIVETLVQDMLMKFIESLPLALVGTFERAKSVVARMNNVVNSVNKIIEDISREGISVPKLELINLTKDDPLTLSVTLKIGKQRLLTIIDFLKELEKYGEEARSP